VTELWASIIATVDNFEVEEFTLEVDDYWNRIGGKKAVWRILRVRLASGEVIGIPEDDCLNTFATKQLADRIAGMLIAFREAGVSNEDTILYKAFGHLGAVLWNLRNQGGCFVKRVRFVLIFASAALSASGFGQSIATYTDLHDFGGTIVNADGASGHDGVYPHSGITFDGAGNGYGTTLEGGANAYGIVWEITASGTYRDLHDFGGTITNADGASGQDGLYPYAGITFDSAGNMYGTTTGGGASTSGDGMVWEITASGNYRDLHDFGGTITNADGASGPDGVYPYAGITFDSVGNMYGTTQQGGAIRAGMVWEITVSGTYRDLHDFGGTVTNVNGNLGPDGADPWAGVTFDGAGNIYGTAYSGGPGYGGPGMVWEISSSGTYWDLHNFGGTIINSDGASGSDGNRPAGGVRFDSAGNMYGTASEGGRYGGGATSGGMVWEITASGTYRDLHDFSGTITNADGASGPDGGLPYAGVTFDGAGNMYGTTQDGGANGAGGYGYGMVWEMTNSGSYVDLHDFGGTIITADGASGPDGFSPSAGVTLDATGKMYGTASEGGANGNPGPGMVWSLLPGPTLVSLTVSPASVQGGAASTGTVTLTRDAPSGGLAVSLSSGSTSATLPSSVTVAAGSTTATFTINTTAVSTTTIATITGSVGSVTLMATLVITPAKLQILTLAPATVTGGTITTGTVTLGGAAGPNGANVSLTSSNTSAVTVPSIVTVAAGAMTGTFTATTAGVSSNVSVTIHGTLNGITQSAILTVEAATLTTIAVSPTSVIGGNPSTATVTLNGPAGPSGDSVSLTSSSSSAIVPSRGTVAAGQTTATFTVNTKAVSATTTSTITGSLNGSQQSATLTINAAGLSRVTVSPVSVIGGNSSTGTVTLNGAAGPGGASVPLTSSNSSATVPASVNVPAGSTSTTFTITTSAVNSTTSVTITGSLAPVSKTAKLSVTGPAVNGLTLNPTTVVGGGSSTATVTLNGMAGPAGTTVNLNSSSSSATVPATVMVPAGATSVRFTVSTTTVASNVSATITASLNGGSTSASLSIEVPLLASLGISPSSVVGGNSATGTVTLARAAPSGGASVSLQASGGINVPASVTVAAGSSSANFTVATTGQSSSIRATVTGTLSGTTRSGSLTITAASLTSLTITPNPVVGGNTAVGTLLLNGAVPASGITVTLKASAAVASVPASVTIPNGASSARFSVPTQAVSKAVTVTVTAQSSAGNQSASITVNPASLESLSLSPSSVVGGSKTSVTGAVTFTGLAASSDTVILKSSDTKLVTVPSSVKVLSRASGATFTVTHKLVTSQQTVTITASYGGMSQTATLSLRPFQVVAVDISPLSVTGGASADGTVTLNAEPGAGSGEITVKLASTSKSVIVPASVMVAEGVLDGLFKIKTEAVSSSLTASVSGTCGSSSQLAKLTVLPPVLVSVSVSPTSVKGSAGTSVAGTVSLSGPAVSGGLKITLSSSDASAASVPTTVTIAAGYSTAKFTVKHSKVSVDTSVTITATVDGTNKTATLTVTP